jgi:hypothetical protein
VNYVIICNICELCEDMAARSLLDPLIDQKHRASHLEADPQSMEPLQTRTPKKNWMIHPQWEDRYLFNCFVSNL